jgi:hypothetical protein
MARQGRGTINHNHQASYTEHWDRQAAREPTLATLVGLVGLVGLGGLVRLSGQGLAAGGGVRLTPVILTILGLVGVVLNLERLPVPEQWGINDGLD